MTRRRLVAWGTAGGLLCGGLVALLVVSTWTDEPEVTTGPDAAAEFVAAWERSLVGTYFVASDFRRVTPNGELEGRHEVAQRPPDVVRRQFGALDGRIGDHPIVCSSDPDGRVSCSRGSAELPPYEEEVADQVAAWHNYFTGDHPIYRVETTGDGCFDLRLSLLIAVPPYGERARFCFDEATGAVIYTEVRRDEGTDVLEAVQVRPVSDADFALPS
jgi:hypothetical protein